MVHPSINGIHRQKISIRRKSSKQGCKLRYVCTINNSNRKTTNIKTGIIIPCYNEEDRLNQKAFVSFIKENKDYHLCFVNDGSKDNTIKVLQEMKNQATNNISEMSKSKKK